MWSHEARATLFLHRLSCVGPSERVGHRVVVVVHEFPQLLLQVGNRREVSAPQELSMDNPEDDLDLVEPRTVLRQVDEADPMGNIREELLARGHRFEDATDLFFFPNPRSSRSVPQQTSPGFPTCAC